MFSALMQRKNMTKIKINSTKEGFCILSARQLLFTWERSSVGE